MMTVNIYGEEERFIFTHKKVIKINTMGITGDKPEILIAMLTAGKITYKRYDANKYAISSVED